jgi:hypothetical protein
MVGADFTAPQNSSARQAGAVTAPPAMGRMGTSFCQLEGLAVRLFKGFKEFILRGNLVDLAVGFVIGAAFSGLVQAFVKD